MSFTVSAVGRLVRDPEQRQAGSYTITQMTVAVKHDRKKQGEQYAESDFMTLQTFNEKIGEVWLQYFAKGSQVFFSGQAEINKYTNKEGVERQDIQVSVNQFQNLTPRDAQPQQQQQSSGFDAPAQSDPFGGSTEVDIADDDLPF